MKANSSLLVMAGGTGGHVFPALAVAKHLESEGVLVSWLGTKRGLEAQVIPQNNIPIEWVSVEGLRGKGGLSVLLAPFKLIRAMWQSAIVIRRLNPDCILGMGGFVSGPGGLVARLMGRRLVVHEQNAVAGLTNKYLAKIADRVLTGFPNVVDMPETATWVGNPVRQGIAAVGDLKTSPSTSAIKLLVVGGSQGAASFNQKLPSVFSKLANVDVSIWHQSGRGHSANVARNYKEVGVQAKVVEFIDDMAEAYQWADVLICRSGAMTIAEACAAGKPALLVPYPFSAGDHQIKNAEAMVKVGAAKMLFNEQLTEPKMIETLTGLLSSKETLQEMGESARQLYKPNALQDVANVCEEFLHA